MISEGDQALIDQWCRSKVLQRINPNRLERRSGLIAVMCPDGDRFDDWFTWEKILQMRPGKRERPFVHPLLRHGGALVLAPSFPKKRSGGTLDCDLIDEILEAQEMKRVREVGLYVHAPCGKAEKLEIGIIRQMEMLLFEAVPRLREIIGKEFVTPFFHAEYRSGRKKSYYLSRSNWEEWSSISHA